MSKSNKSEFGKEIDNLREFLEIAEDMFDAKTLPHEPRFPEMIKLLCPDRQVRSFHLERPLFGTKGVWGPVKLEGDTLWTWCILNPYTALTFTIKVMVVMKECCYKTGVLRRYEIPCECDQLYRMCTTNSMVVTGCLDDLLWVNKVSPTDIKQRVLEEAQRWNKRRHELAALSARVVERLTPLSSGIAHES